MLIMVFLLYCALLATAAAPEDQLGKTRLIGRDVAGSQQEFFGGIPFAEPPVGALRLQRPIPKTNIDADESDAQDFGLPCLVQRGLDLGALSEDCLTINIFRPKGTSSKDLLPVMFWTYGGGFYVGAASFYNGSNIVAQSVARGTPIIYVNHNYRLGPLGFPQGQEADNRGQLNLGVRDQLAALEWVQKNIGLFGGDQTKVTIFGESAGTILTNLLFLHPSISNLARAAIFESGSASSPAIYNASTRESVWQSFVAGTPGCESVAGTGNTFDCLRAANSSAIYEGFVEAYELANEMYPFTPVLDGPSGLLPDFPSRLWARGEFAMLPFISGTNLDERTRFLSTNRSYTDEDIKDYMATTHSSFPPYISGAILERLLELYPDDPSVGSPYNTGEETFGLASGFKRVASISRHCLSLSMHCTHLSFLAGDLIFDAQCRTWTQAAAQAGVKAYGYQFTQNTSLYPPEWGVPHASDETSSSMLLSEMMIDYWVSFAASLDPNDGLGMSRPFWPQYMPGNAVLLQLSGDNVTVIPDDYRKEQIEYLRDNADAFHR
ncbi:extracellular triacylglycerol lipase precursor [Desarmillaria tabescens]|uniref:Carboxylic ester hydrolase n=1 Tax=Armillaria tabescens TaxID=1929756 RepID=A0AA39N7V5_ARMTA|nr:extracellular triacylglycerol lipase precursor [Desarmillaria tabescens]KAK0460642.1 extracellular triacylglycerol lipase precursor [Desarmillaria tabescens]